MVKISIPESFHISIEEAANHLKVDPEFEADQIQYLIESAYERVSNETHGAIALVDVEQDLTGFKNTVLLYGPVVSIEEVTYTDEDDQEQILSDDNYYYHNVLNMIIFKGELPDGDNIKVSYQCGYPKLPGPLRSAILLYLADLYEVRQTIFSGGSVQDVGIIADRLIHPYVRYNNA